MRWSARGPTRWAAFPSVCRTATRARAAGRLDAVQALQAKASLYAQAMGYRVARLVTLSEGGGYSPPSPVPMLAMAMRDKAESTPVEAGELKVRIDISATFELV